MHLESSISGEALTDYTVRNMGYVAVAAFNASAHVRLRPEIAAPRALEALLCWFRDRATQRVLISTFEKGWRHELMPSNDATKRMAAMVCQAEPRETYARQDRPRCLGLY